jgi:CDP-glucose 4,6-dehydratase
MHLEFWKDKKVFITGHTGFKGSWLALWLNKLGAELKGYALPPNTEHSLFDIAGISELIDHQVGDVRNFKKLKKSILEFSPEIIIHLAAQPLVRKSYQDPIYTYETNVMGTVHLLEASRACSSIKAIVNVTSDKCYENNEWLWGYREFEPMGGYDPYSNSKGCSELVTSAFRRSFFGTDSGILLASARAGNVIGGGDWSEDRLVSDALRAFEKKIPLVVRNPSATRPWQHVLEPISGYLTLAENLFLSKREYAEGWNFGPKDEDARPVSDILDFLVDHWPEEASWVKDENEQPHEAQLLKLDISKAQTRLRWQPRWELNKTLHSIIDWHKSWLEGADMREITYAQIKNYEDSRS